MNVLHVIDSLDPSKGGPQVVVPSLAAAQARLGYRVVILSNHPAEVESAVREVLKEIPDSEKVIRINLPRRSALGKCLALEARRRLPGLVSRETFVHLHGVWEPLLWLAAREARRQGASYAVRLCGMLQPGQMNRCRLAKALVFLLGAQKMLREATFIHALTMAEAQFARPYIGRARAEAIPNGVFPEKYENHPPAGSFYERHPELDRCPYVLFLSRLHYHKGLMLLVQAFVTLASKLPRIHLVVAGPDGGERATVEKKVRQCGLDHRVHILGPVYGNEKAAVFRDASCFCLPSRSEGLSNAVLEALAYGVPVVISEECYFSEVAKAGAGEVVPRHPEAIAGALVRVLSDPARRQQMSLAALRMIREDYDWHKIARRTIALYEQALGNPERKEAS